MSIFKNKSFDSILGGVALVNLDELRLNEGQRLVVDGTIKNVKKIFNTPNEGSKPDLKSTLIVNGEVTASEIRLPNVVINGRVEAETLWVEGTLALQSNAKLTAKVVYYRHLVIEQGAVILAELRHLDHVSEGEQT